jgi:hypothetical protein
MPSNEELLEARGLGGAVGITDEVLAFAGNIRMHPETWLDLPPYAPWSSLGRRSSAASWLRWS